MSRIVCLAAVSFYGLVLCGQEKDGMEGYHPRLSGSPSDSRAFAAWASRAGPEAVERGFPGTLDQVGALLQVSGSLLSESALSFFHYWDSLPPADRGRFHLPPRTAIIMEAEQDDRVRLEVLQLPDPDSLLVVVHIGPGAPAAHRLDAVSTAPVGWSDGAFRLATGRARKIRATPGTYHQALRAESGRPLVLNVAGKQGTLASITLPARPPRPPFIRVFAFSDSHITEGEEAVLNWFVCGARQVSIDPAPGTRPPAGQILLEPEDSRTYELTASNAAGRVQATAAVEVESVFLREVEMSWFVPAGADPKESASLAHLALTDRSGRLVCRMESGEGQVFAGEGENGSYYGAFRCTPEEPFRRRDVGSGELRMGLAGPAADRWGTSPLVVLHFTDGSSVPLYGFGIHTLDTRGRDVRVGF